MSFAAEMVNYALVEKLKGRIRSDAASMAERATHQVDEAIAGLIWTGAKKLMTVHQELEFFGTSHPELAYWLKEYKIE